MAINYAKKYATKIAELYSHGSYTDADCGNGYKWTGPDCKTIVVDSVDTVPETQYRRSGSNRYGEVVDLGSTEQEMTCTQTPSFAFTIDALDESDRAIEISAASALARQLKRVTVPNMDKYRLKKWAMGANIVKLSASEPTKTTLGDLIVEVHGMMTDAQVPDDNLTLFLPVKMYTVLKRDPNWISNPDLGKEAMRKGYIGEFDGLKVKKIPNRFFPNGLWFMIKAKDATVDPVKMKSYKIRKDAQGYSGPVVEGVSYYDSFVLGAHGDGVAVCGNSEFLLTAPKISPSGANMTVSPASGVKFLYTTDGTNPRYSTTAEVYSSQVTLQDGETIRVVPTKDGCNGPEASQTYTA